MDNDSIIKSFINLGEVIKNPEKLDLMEEEIKIIKNVYTYRYETLITKEKSNYVFDIYKNKEYINDIIEIYNYINDNATDSTKSYINDRALSVKIIPSIDDNENFEILKKGIIVITEIRNAFKHNNSIADSDDYTSQFDSLTGLCKINGNIKCLIPIQYIKDFGNGIKIEKKQDEKDDEYLKRIELHQQICNSIYENTDIKIGEIPNNINQVPLDFSKYKFLKEQGFTEQEIINLPENIRKDSLEDYYSLTEIYIKFLGKENLSKLNLKAYSILNNSIYIILKKK